MKEKNRAYLINSLSSLEKNEQLANEKFYRLKYALPNNIIKWLSNICFILEGLSMTRISKVSQNL